MVNSIANILDNMKDTKVGKYLNGLIGNAYTRRLKKYYFSITPDVAIGWTNKLSILFGDNKLFVKESMCLAVDYAGLFNLCFHYSESLNGSFYQDGQFISDSIHI